MVRRFFTSLLDFLFPQRCLGCRQEGTVLCKACFRSIVRTTRQCCPVCRCIESVGFTCTSCKRETAIDRMLIATDDRTGIVRRMIHFFKYRCITEYDTPLSGLLLQSFLHDVLSNEEYVLVPVPLHPRRLRYRGFNQSERLARILGSVCDISVLTSLVIRHRYTTAQMKLSRTARLHNVRDAFSCPAKIPPKDILLIDDVATTGATLDECARTLKRAGARTVTALVLSRGT